MNLFVWGYPELDPESPEDEVIPKFGLTEHVLRINVCLAAGHGIFSAKLC